jgi:hypothetical protein
MRKPNHYTVLQALELILGERTTVLPVSVPQPREVRVTLDKEVTPEQFRDLAQLGAYMDNYPAIKRSGAGVSVVFNC